MLQSFSSSAPIEPGTGMGGIRLRTHISQMFEVIRHLHVRGDSRPASKDGEASLQSPYHVQYNLAIGVTMVFNLINGRIYKLVADKRYSGTLFGRLRTGMPLQDALRLEPGLVFDEMEEVYHIPGISGVAIEADVNNDHIEAIAVYVAELEEVTGSPQKSEDFERGRWS